VYIGEFLGEYPQFYLMPNGEEVEYNELVCPKCGTKFEATCREYALYRTAD
jgi:hypothetical protein